MGDDVKEVHVTGDAAAYLEPPKKRTRRAKRSIEPVEPVEDVVKTMAKEPVKEVVKTMAKEPVKEVVKIMAKEPVKEVVKIMAKEPVKEVVKIMAKEPVKEVVKIMAKEPVKEVVKIMAKEPSKPSIPLTKTRKRQFKAKKISLLIAEADPKTRKARKVIAKKVADMGLEELRVQLETQGLIKHGKKHVPEDMLRSMMRDALTLSEGK